MSLNLIVALHNLGIAGRPSSWPFSGLDINVSLLPEFLVPLWAPLAVLESIVLRLGLLCNHRRLRDHMLRESLGGMTVVVLWRVRRSVVDDAASGTWRETARRRVKTLVNDFVWVGVLVDDVPGVEKPGKLRRRLAASLIVDTARGATYESEAAEGNVDERISRADAALHPYWERREKNGEESEEKVGRTHESCRGTVLSE